MQHSLRAKQSFSYPRKERKLQSPNNSKQLFIEFYSLKSQIQYKNNEQKKNYIGSRV